MSTEYSVPKYLLPHPHAQHPHYQHPPSEGDIVTVMSLLGHVPITPNPVCIRVHFWCLHSVDLEDNVKCKVRRTHPCITQSVFTALMILCALTTHPSLPAHPWQPLIFLLSPSVQFSHSVVSNSLRPHELQHARPPCPSPAPRVHPNPRPLSR